MIILSWCPAYIDRGKINDEVRCTGQDLIFYVIQVYDNNNDNNSITLGTKVLISYYLKMTPPYLFF